MSASLSLEYFAFITFDNATMLASFDSGNFILDVIASQDCLNDSSIALLDSSIFVLLLSAASSSSFLDIFGLVTPVIFPVIFE